jgi:hypothetical protein
MDHSDLIEIIKASARVGRRLEGKKLAREALEGTEQECLPERRRSSRR